ncbi:N-carbamoyl-L-amino acid amidohydrolase [Thioalkalivibrio nitratireducens DSM 14787]|uniref:N-carbamoyl-L-amino acid amidohydrolase n=1 Tax=Thioalkalivibrio nitratireducens (strain DSM 14787 / UNIQEM 213 / ALEN2) TaxID=1255043 RepID=L0E403_THIND|nr:N-carbamoyl-L-amino acid amidohydrolase [Thioalkalivibrio nitratireducens DSM 14787]
MNMERLRQDVMDLAQVGRDTEFGLNRRAFTECDRQGRDWFRQRLAVAGLEVHQDGAANLHGRLEFDGERPAVVMGSHLDTVPGGGPLDGALGVLVGLEVLRTVKERAIPLRFPLEVIDFTDEEGRFGGLFGSQAMAGQLTPERIHGARDLEGTTLVDAMAGWGLDANEALGARRDPNSIHAFLELHIEQGPVLDRRRIGIGVVEAITGLFKWEVRLKGQANHAGTTPMDMRIDAFQGLAEFGGEIHRILEEHGGPNSRATIGRVELKPGAANTIPGLATFSLEVRDTDDRVLKALSDACRRTLSSIARRRDLMFEFDVLSEIPPAKCDPGLVELISREAEAMGQSYLCMASGAAHDAQSMTSVARTGMIFVPSIEGRSHSAGEWTNWEDIEAGANLMLRSVLALAARD